jgi:thiol peroxidase
MLHDPENTFGESYSILIPELNRYARVIYVLDQEGVIRYEEIVPEMAQEPDYDKALAVAKALV